MEFSRLVQGRSTALGICPDATMGLDALSPTAPARVKALVLPIGHVRQSRFNAFLRRLQQENVVRLGDVSPDSRPNRSKQLSRSQDGRVLNDSIAMFSPLAFPDGLVHFELSASFAPSSHLDLVPFELYRLPLLVIGIADGQENFLKQHNATANGEEDDWAGQLEALSQGFGTLKEDYRLALVQRLLVFDCMEEALQLPEGIALVPPLAKSRTTTIKTIMCDMTSALLGEMTSYAKSLQALSTVETPYVGKESISNGIASAIPHLLGGSSRPLSFSARSRSSSPAMDTRHAHRMSMPAHVSSMLNSRSSTPENPAMSPPSGTKIPPTSFEEMGATTPTTSPPRRISRDAGRPKSQESVAMNGFGPGSVRDKERNKSKARVGVLLGAMYLLAGRWPDAAKELSNSVVTARASSDYVWQAKAMDYLLVCLLMCAWAGMDFRVSISHGNQRLLSFDRGIDDVRYQMHSVHLQKGRYQALPRTLSIPRPLASTTSRRRGQWIQRSEMQRSNHW